MPRPYEDELSIYIKSLTWHVYIVCKILSLNIFWIYIICSATIFINDVNDS